MSSPLKCPKYVAERASRDPSSKWVKFNSKIKDIKNNMVEELVNYISVEPQTIYRFPLSKLHAWLPKKKKVLPC